MLVFNVTDQVRETIQQTLYTLLMDRESVFRLIVGLAAVLAPGRRHAGRDFVPQSSRSLDHHQRIR